MEVNQTFEQFKLKSDYAIDTNKKRISELKSIAMDTYKNKANYDKQVAALESKNSELKMKLINYKEDNNWEVFKNEFNKEITDLEKAVRDLAVNNVN